MKGFFIGTIVVIGSAVSMPVLMLMGLFNTISAVVVMGVAFVGFIIQMWSAFIMKFGFEREMRQKREAHEALKREVAKLPPQEVIDRLLGSNEEMKN